MIYGNIFKLSPKVISKMWYDISDVLEEGIRELNFIDGFIFELFYSSSIHCIRYRKLDKFQIMGNWLQYTFEIPFLYFAGYVALQLAMMLTRLCFVGTHHPLGMDFCWEISTHFGCGPFRLVWCIWNRSHDHKININWI